MDKIKFNLITIDMGTFIEEYLKDPTLAISSALEQLTETNRFEQVDDDAIYNELATGEFRLYEEIILSQLSEESPSQKHHYKAAV